MKMEHEIHIWSAMLDESFPSPADSQQFLRVLSAAERLQCAKFRFEADRRRDLATRMLLRSVLSSYADLPPQAWTFARDAYGKPRISNPGLEGRLHFNLTHTHGLVNCAVAPFEQIGIDAEWTGRTGLEFGIAQRYFNLSEWTDLRETASAHRARRFFQYWTVKEAYAKARGLGLSLPLDAIEVLSFDGTEVSARLHGDDAGAGWHFVQTRLADTHVVSLAAKCAGPALPPIRSFAWRGHGVVRALERGFSVGTAGDHRGEYPQTETVMEGF